MDLLSPKRITGIVTQGAKDFGSIQFVSSFKIAHSNDGRSWTVLQDETTRKDKVGSASWIELTPTYKKKLKSRCAY